MPLNENMKSKQINSKDIHVGNFTKSSSLHDLFSEIAHYLFSRFLSSPESAPVTLKPVSLITDSVPIWSNFSKAQELLFGGRSEAFIQNLSFPKLSFYSLGTKISPVKVIVSENSRLYIEWLE
jgi:hypothetical protein